MTPTENLPDHFSRPQVRSPSPWKVRNSPAGIHYFDRSSGSNLLLDEVVLPPDRWHQGPRHVSIALTNACDLHCSYCYAPKSRATIAADLVRSWLLELDHLGTLGIGFGGGEPTLYPDFAALCRFASSETGLAVSFTSHGHHLTPDLCQALDSHVHFVRLSMDGVEETYQRLRGRPFAAFLDRVRLVSSMAPFGLNVVVNADTISQLDAVAEIAEREGAREILLLPEFPTVDRPGLAPQLCERLAAWIGAYRGPVRLSISERAADGLPTCDPCHLDRGLRAYAHVSASGVLRPTSFDTSGVPIGPEGFLHALNQLRFLSL